MTGQLNILNDSSAERLKELISGIEDKIERGFDEQRWGDLPKWRSAVEQLPQIKISSLDLNADMIRIGNAADASDEERRKIEEHLMALHPWRKGPFELFGLHIDTEWRSDLKWNRLKDHISPIKDRTVLDIGCGNGYHCLRMAGAGAEAVLGLDPTAIYPMQFLALNQYIRLKNTAVVPLGIDDMTQDCESFDTVFSMGLLYHRRAPFDHLLQLKGFLRQGGELVLETLIIEGNEGDVLSPAGRYAKMPNVWFIPSVPTLTAWLKRMQFENVRCVDVSVTTSEEQRVTPWMGFHSLEDFLDPDDSSKTVEGYPAPRRAILIANKP